MRQRSAVYKLLDMNDTVVYVGQTQDIALRLLQHTIPSSRSFPNQKLKIEVIQWFNTRREARAYELIQQKEYGFTPETQKMSESQKGRKHSEETIAKISAGSRGRKRSDETRAKISAAGKGRKHSEETIAKISESKKGQVSLIKGRKLSEEHKAKIRASLLKAHSVRLPELVS